MNRGKSILVALSAVCLMTSASAQLKITEMMSHASAVPDYFEITNFGASLVDITGWRFDDDSADFAQSALLDGVTGINGGESVVFFELDIKDPNNSSYDPAAETQSFRDAFGGLSGVQIGHHDGAGLGGSGDAVNIFDQNGNLMLTQAYSGGHAGEWAGGTDTDAAIYVPGTVDDWTFAQAGVLDSIQTPQGDWGNPGTIGAVPEPATMSLLGLGLAALAARKRRKG